jgi:voltage-gated potassium channel
VVNPPELPRLGLLRLPEGSPVLALVRRAALAVVLIVAVAALLWVDRDGLRDNAHPDRPLGFIDVFYFTVVSLTTVGYGDIAPVTDAARLINALVLTPIRVFLWALFLGTAYELSVLRLQFREDRRMRELQDRLNDHVIVGGYGVKGRAAIDELLAHGQPRDQVVVIDPDEEAAAAAVRDGLVALRGDASSEALLRAAAVEKAGHVVVAPDRDDACVLICLTVRNLAPGTKLVAAAREEENVKLIYAAGADLVIAPSVSGGRLMGAAVRQRGVPAFLEDLLSFGHGMAAAELVVGPAERGRRPDQLPAMAGRLVLGVVRGNRRVPFDRLADFALEQGDVVVYLTGEPVHDHAARRP